MKSENIWRGKLERCPKSKRIISNSRNVESILSNGDLANCIAFDDFKLKMIIKKDLPWKGIPDDKKFDIWDDYDKSRLMHYLNKHFDISGGQLIENACIEIAMQNKTNTVKDYITSEKWDGIKRIEYVFQEYLGAEDNVYVRGVSKVFFVAAVKRALEPGCKYDYVVVLVGDQGIRKSSFVEKIGGEWYSAGPQNFKGKSAAEILQNAWIIELPELSALKNTGDEETKAFITKRLDEYRPSYGRHAQMYPRKCVFIGTTNDYNFLRDETGNRRFLPIDLEQSRIKKELGLLNTETVSQLWAEAYHYYLNNEKVYLTGELEKLARIEQEKHFMMDPLQGVVEEYLKMPIPNEWNALLPEERHNHFSQYLSTDSTLSNQTYREKVAPIEIFVEALGNSRSKFNNYESKKISTILTKIGYKNGSQKRARFKHYGQQVVYFYKKNLML